MQEIYVDEAGRLDIFLAKCLQKSRSQVAQLIKNGGVKCNGVLCEKASFKLKMGDKLEVIEFAANFAAQNLTPNFKAQNLTPNFTQNLTNQNSKPNFSAQNLTQNCENQNSTQNFKSQNDFLNQNLTQNSASKNDFTSQNFATNFVSQNSNSNFAPQISTQNFTPKYPINFDIAVLYEDSEVLVLNKPAGVVVHSAPSVREATLVDWLLAKGYALSNLGGQLRAGLVHRLDKGTSGALIIAKNNAAHESLCKQLQNRALGRFYLALTDLPLKEDIICVEKPLIRCPKNRLKKLAVSGFARGARTAKTAFANVLCGRDFGENLGKNLGENVNFGVNLDEISSKKLNSLINLNENSGANLNENLNVNLGKNVNFETNLGENLESKKRTACVVDCHDFATQNLAMTSSRANSKPNLNKILNINLIAAKLFTGRTHQIRAHLESLNRHILGDKLYGYKGKDYERVMLHAYFLYFTHPKTGEEMLVKAPLFEDFKQILNHFDEGELYEKLSATYIKRLFSAVS